jgi:hypothetical protein
MEDATNKGTEESTSDSSKNNSNNNGTRAENEIIFPATAGGARDSVLRHETPLFSERNPAVVAGTTAGGGTELMGPILRRKKVLSMPLAAGGDFFITEDVGGPHRQLQHRERQLSYGATAAAAGTTREKQLSHEGDKTTRQRQVTPTSLGTVIRQRTKQSSFMDNLVRRKQISLDLLGPNDFFATPTEEEGEIVPLAPSAGEITVVPEDAELEEGQEPADRKKEDEKKLFLPLRFSKPLFQGKRAAGGHGHTGGHGPTPEISHGPSMYVTKAQAFDEEAYEAIKRQSRHSETLKLQLSALQKKIAEEEDAEKKRDLESVSSQILETQTAIEEDQNVLLSKLTKEQEEAKGKQVDATEAGGEESDDLIKPSHADFADADDGIVRADKCDKIKAAIVFLIMLTFTVVVCTWETHINAESHIYSPVGLACVTDCPGNLETRDFFAHEHNHFEPNELIQLIIHLDPNQNAEDHTFATVQIVGEESGHVKAVRELGPVSHEDRLTFDAYVKVDFDDPEEHHIINVNSTDPNVELSFTLVAEVKTPLANYSVIVAAVIMVVVYAFILVEVIHRTLIAIFGSVSRIAFWSAPCLVIFVVVFLFERAPL